MLFYAFIDNPSEKITSDLCEGHWTHLEAILRHKEFLPIAFDWKEIEPWAGLIAFLSLRRVGRYAT